LKHHDRNTESVDDYLKAIHSLGGDERRRVGGSELAARLQVAPASVTNMLQKLAGEPKSLVDYKRGEGSHTAQENEENKEQRTRLPQSCILIQNRKIHL
jgi:Mn-dependent DtxR family transcriptional regulator